MIAINLMSSKYNDEEAVMHWKCDNIETIINYQKKKLQKKFFSYFFQDIRLD